MNNISKKINKYIGNFDILAMNKYINENSNFILLVVLIVISLHFILFKTHKKREKAESKEGFDIMKGFDDLKNSLSSVGDLARKIPGEINSIGTKIDGVGDSIKSGVDTSVKKIKTGIDTGVSDVKNTATSVTKEIDTKLKNFIKEVEDVTKKVVIEKILSFFDQIKNILNKAIVEPFQTLFVGIGNIFMSIIDILKMIGDKISGLPGCMSSYMVDGIISSTSAGLRFFLPQFIMYFVEILYRGTIGFLLYLTGFDVSINKCKQFDVSKSVDNMTNNLNNISNTFKSNFGNIPPLRL
jgi:hypothetical protein